MKRFFQIICLLLFFGSLHAQDIQWIKRGGGYGSGEQEEVYQVITDSEQNIYTLSIVTDPGLTIDGHDKTYLGNTGTGQYDVALASFSCDGTYRWSKIIGGKGHEYGIHMVMDDDDNLFISGRFGTCSEANDMPPAIDDDVVLPQSMSSCSLLFLAKYDNEGNLQWIRQPQDPNSYYSIYSFTGGKEIYFEDGILYWLVEIPPGTYENGSFENTNAIDRSYFIFQYDTDGNFLSSTPIDIETGAGDSPYLHFYRNPYNGHYYFTGKSAANIDTYVAGEEVMNSTYMASFDAQGNFLWKRENSITGNGGYRIFGLQFDSQNNIYLGGKTGGDQDSFLGFTMEGFGFNGYVMKVDPTAENLIWGSNSDRVVDGAGDVLLHNGILHFTSYSGNVINWGDQSLTINGSGELSDVLLASFDASTGDCTNLFSIEGDQSYYDYGTSLAVDNAGDVIIGGGFGHRLYDTYGNDVLNSGPETDFFVAKYATNLCNTVSVGDVEMQQVKVFPNPARDVLHVETPVSLSYQIYGITGALIMEGTVKDQGINIAHLPASIYLLKFTNGEGESQTIKLVKE